jgi:hypothetical protein
MAMAMATIDAGSIGLSVARVEILGGLCGVDVAAERRANHVVHGRLAPGRALVERGSVGVFRLTRRG